MPHPNDAFTPPIALRNPIIQSLLASSALRAIGPNPMLAAEREVIVDAGGGVRLQGFLSTHSARPRSLVILLHGWEGSAASAYMKRTGRFLYRTGYDVFRLNLRDHGTSHHLNEGLFLGTLIEEVFAAIRAISAGAGVPSVLAGFSLGANFALRVARRAAVEPVPGLRHILCVNPPLDPHASTLAIDGIGIFRNYFLKKWKRSLAIKQSCFPAAYDFSGILAMRSCMAITDALMARHTSFASSREYFDGYTLTDGRVDRVGVPTTVITAEDDPVVPARDFHALEGVKDLSLIVHRYGGHCGYIENVLLRSWYQNALAEIVARVAR
ncbi:MAG TPA: alpha/beta fold hydrolase [Spirochaetota bacterium]|nr:alpha/beta fold hydrolase [Spirochaetota bacterium]